MTCGRSCLAPSRVSISLPRGRGALQHEEQQRVACVRGRSLRSLADTAGTSDLNETVQIIAAHVKAIRRLGERLSIWHPEASKSYRERAWRESVPLQRQGRWKLSLCRDLEKALLPVPRPHSRVVSPPTHTLWPGGPVCDSLGRRVTAAGCSDFSINRAYVF